MTERDIQRKAARELSGLVAERVRPYRVAVVPFYAGGYAAALDLDVVQLRADYSPEGLRTFGWQARRDPVARRGWRRWLPSRRSRWRDVGRLADLADLL